MPDTRYLYELVATVLKEIARVVTDNVFSGTFPEAMQLAAFLGGLDLFTITRHLEVFTVPWSADNRYGLAVDII